MSIFDKFSSFKVSKQPSKNPSIDPSKDPNMIHVFDAYGREMFITKEDWRKDVLPDTIQSNWNDPDKLYGVIVSSLDDGFASDVLTASKHFYKIDPDFVRGTCIYGIVLTRNNRLDEAEHIFQSYIKEHGENGYVLTNLAKVYAERNNHQKVEEILWRALENDPNQDNGVSWYLAICRERGDEAEALKRISKIPGSWRAQLWLAREELQKNNLEAALDLYRGCLACVAKPIPADLLMQMSGDLGRAGKISIILQLVEPHFDVHIHGLSVGNNLIKANLELKRFDAAYKVLNQLYVENRQDWKGNLSFWDTEIAKAKVAACSVNQNKLLKVVMLIDEAPVWLKSVSPVAELFPAKSKDVPIIAFLGSSVEKGEGLKNTQLQLADASGRMSRSLPLFLAEQVKFKTNARAQTLIPWVSEPNAGFVLSGVAWKDEDAADHSKQGLVKSDYVVTIHLDSTNAPWVVELRLVRSIDGKCLADFSTLLLPSQLEGSIPQLAGKLLSILSQNVGLEIQSPPTLYHVPIDVNFGNYLLRLEQLLAIRCQGGSLNGEREIIDGNLQLSLACPDNAGIRIVLAQTLHAMKKVRPDILPEFKDRILLLQKEKPLLEPAQSVVQGLLNEVFSR